MLVGAITLGVVFMAVGPGSCALACYGSAGQVDEIFETCATGDVEACNDVTRSLHFGEQLAHDLPALATKCGAPVGHTKRTVGLEVDAPYEWTSHVTVVVESGDCQSPPLDIELVDGPWKWRVNRIAPVDQR
ncbi:MAG: hypothetical protein IAG13_06135 [Deltaproteobacteria bacterium]|nr:hypothetical protein [Nannocystaceae bacterium]